MGPPVHLPRYKLVVFDWDGTLIDSIAAIVGCTQATLRELGLPPADESSLRSAIGLGIEEMVESFCPGYSPAVFRDIVSVYRRIWFGGFAVQSVLFEGVSDTLSRLSNQGCSLAIATAKSRRGLCADLDRTGVGDFFEASRTADEAASKPSPAMLEELLEEVGVHRDEALMIGDAVHDLQMAHNAGVACVAVASGTAGRLRLLENRPLTCLDTVADLPGWFERNTRHEQLESTRGKA